MPTFWRRQLFLAGIILALPLAALFPSLGAKGGLLPVGGLSLAGVWAIFFLQGLALPAGQFRQGLRCVRLHLWVQACIFLLGPTLALAIGALLSSHLAPPLHTGFALLGILPTTIASAIVFTSLARGNVAACVVNAVFANLLGVILVPLFLLWHLGHQERVSPPAGPVLRQLFLLVAVPLALGQLARWRAPALARRAQPFGRPASSGIIVFLVWVAFSDSFAHGAWQTIGLDQLFLSLLGVSLLLLALHLVAYGGARSLRLPPGDVVVALFAGPQKTLAAGIPMAEAIFSPLAAGGLALGPVLTPLLLYHPLQLVLAAFLVRWLDARQRPRS